jgi:hypothetical protein
MIQDSILVCSPDPRIPHPAGSLQSAVVPHLSRWLSIVLHPCGAVGAHLGGGWNVCAKFSFMSPSYPLSDK